jgi:hypothetical protein
LNEGLANDYLPFSAARLVFNASTKPMTTPAPEGDRKPFCFRQKLIQSDIEKVLKFISFEVARLLLDDTNAGAVWRSGSLSGLDPVQCDGGADDAGVSPPSLCPLFGGLPWPWA